MLYVILGKEKEETLRQHTKMLFVTFAKRKDMDAYLCMTLISLNALIDGFVLIVGYYIRNYKL